MRLEGYKSNDFKYDNIRLYFLGGYVPTGVKGVGEVKNSKIEKTDGKFLINGKIVIVKNGRIYSLDGCIK